MIDQELPSLADSLWTTARRLQDRWDPPGGDIDTDITIIGGGYTGLSCALHLAERGYAPVVLEARQPGWGRSGRNGGQVIAGLKEDPDTIEADFGAEMGARMVALSGNAPSRLFEICRRYDIDCDLRDSGWIQPAHSTASLVRQRRLVHQWQQRGADVVELSAAQISEMVGSGIYKGGQLDRRGGSIHPLNFALGLARAADGKGARIYGETPMLACEKMGDNFSIRTPVGRVQTRTLVMCTNGYTPAQGGTVRKIARAVAPVFSLQVATAPLAGDVRATILPGGQTASDTRRLLHYYRLDPDGRLVMGGRGAYGERARLKCHAGIREAAQKVLPQIGSVRWEHAWGGLVAMTRDHYPHLAEPAPGFLTAHGYNGRGVAMAVALGAVLADRVAGASIRSLAFPMTPIRPIRFHGLRIPAVSALIHWNKLLDRLGR